MQRPTIEKRRNDRLYAIVIFLYIEHGYIMTAIAVLHKDEILKRVAKGDKISRNKIAECQLSTYIVSPQ